MRKCFLAYFGVLFFALNTDNIVFSENFNNSDFSENVSLHLSQQSIQKKIEKESEIFLPIEQTKNRLKKKAKNVALVSLALGGAAVGGAVGLVLAPPVMVLGGILISNESHNPRKIIKRSCQFGLLTLEVCTFMGAEKGASLL